MLDRYVTDRFKFDLKRCDSQEIGVCERSAQDHDRVHVYDLLFRKTLKEIN